MIDLRSMYLMEHVFECSVVVVWVRRRDFVGDKRRRVQELHVGLDCGLVEVMGLGLITCGEEEVVRGKAWRGAIGVSNFLRAFLMVSLNSLSSGSMK